MLYPVNWKFGSNNVFCSKTISRIVIVFIGIHFPCLKTTAHDDENGLIAKLKSKCGINIDNNFFNSYSSASIPYNSRLGRGLQKCFDIPKPPLTAADSSLVNPPRSVDAKNWNSTYCKTWKDNKTECYRSSRYSSVRCSPINGNTTALYKYIICDQIFDTSEIGDTCSKITVYSLNIGESNSINVDILDETDWYYEYNIKLKSWSSKFYDGSNNNFLKRNSPSRTLTYDYVCENRYLEDNGRNLVINLGEDQ